MVARKGKARPFGLLLQTRKQRAAHEQQKDGDVHQMTKKELVRLRGEILELPQLRAELEELEARIYNPKIPQLSPLPKGGAGVPRTVENAALMHERLRQMYAGKIESIETAQAKLEEALTHLTPLQARLIRYRYIDGLTFESVADRIGYTWQHTHRIHAAALAELEKIE